MMASAEATDLERDEIRANSRARQAAVAAVRHLHVACAAGLDFGKSFLTGQSAMGLILERMPATLELAIVSLGLSMLVGAAAGHLGRAAAQRDQHARHHDRLGAGFSLPNFWVGLMLIMVFAVYLGWLPASLGRGATRHMRAARL